MENNNIPETITEFIADHHVLTLATTVNNQPYCCNCFYVFMEKERCFVFTSDDNTKHIQDVKQNNFVAGSVVLETTVIGKIQGIQFTGEMYEPKNELLSKAKLQYLKKFPFAVLMNTQLWVVEVNFIKMTDNRLGFGKKLVWKKN